MRTSARSPQQPTATTASSARPSRRAWLALGSVLSVGALLVGCAAADPDPDPAPTTTPSPTEQPGAGYTGPDPSAFEELFTVSSTATAPSGELLEIELTAYLPVFPEEQAGVDLIAAVEAENPDSPVLDVAAQTDAAATLQFFTLRAAPSEGDAWPQDARIVVDLGQDVQEDVFGIPAGPLTGDGENVLTGVGEGWGVAFSRGTEAAKDPELWAGWPQSWGFEPIEPNTPQLDDCAIAVTELGESYRAEQPWADIMEDNLCITRFLG